MKNAYELDYESLRGHRLWVEPESRRSFRSRQTVEGEPKGAPL